MGSWIFLLGVLVHVTVAEPQCFLTVPAVLHGSRSNAACVHFSNLNETVSASVVLEYDSHSYGLWEDNVHETDFSQCFDFKVPPAAAASDAIGFIVFSVKGPSSFSFHERKSIAVRNISTITLIQTDKPTYKPNQEVMFRVVTVDTDFRPVNRTYPLIYMQDPQGNRIAQWLNQTPSYGILELSLLIPEGANLGSYHIFVKNTPYDSIHSFVMEEYVLPLFGVTLKAPQRVSPFDEEFKVDVCAEYTYGQPVQGKVQLRVCRQRFYHPRCNRDSNGICEAVSAELGKDSCVSKMIGTKAFHLYANQNRNRYFFTSLQVEGVVTENGTGVQISSSNYVSVHHPQKSVSFEDTDRYYKRKIPFTGEIRVRDEDGEPLANGLVFLEFDGQVVANYTTDGSGTARFSIDTSELAEPRYKLRATYRPDQCTEYGWLDTDEPEAVHYIQRFFSRTDSYMHIESVLEELPCGQHRDILVHYVLNKDQDEELPATNVYFNYLLVNRGRIVDGGKQEVRIQAGQYGTFAIQLKISPKLAPRTRMLVYAWYGELLADSISFEVEKCFRNKVSLQFSETEALPGSPISLHLNATPNSFCAFRAVDKSVLLLRSGQDLTPESVYAQLPYLDAYGYYHHGLDLDDDSKQPCIEQKNAFYKGLYYVPVNVTNDGNVYDILKDMGLKVFINSTLQKPVVCRNDFECKRISGDDYGAGSGYGGGVAEMADLASSRRGSGMVETVRDYFPETWMFDMLLLDSSGNSKLSYTVPDTVTEWQANVFCLEDTAGFGTSKPAFLKAFLPFFVDLTMPYSVVRGEAFVLKVNVFNYMNECIEARATLEPSQDYTGGDQSEGDFTRLCANERRTYTWSITPRTLGMVNFTVIAEAKSGQLTVGRRDTIIKPLLVEPEGVKKEVTHSSLICTNGTTVHESVTLKLPENVVEGSPKAAFFVLGDVLGTALSASERFLQMPYGCGEQNLAMFKFNLILFNYLNRTGQLTEEKRSKMVGHLVSGYQRQLSYKNPDGSFSTFGSRTTEGNVWLTASVYGALAQSKKIIYIEDNLLSGVLNWLAKQQESDGSFPSEWKIFNNALQDGGNLKLIVTAYVVVCLKEAGLPNLHPVVKSGLSYLDAAMNKGVETLVEKSLLAHAYSLADRPEHLKSLLEDLKRSAVQTGEFVYWEREKKPQVETYPSFSPRASSVQIEVNSRSVLAFLGLPSLSKEDLTFISQAIRWIVGQQNSYGGFSSTQDTVVALHALAEYGVHTFTKGAQNTVAIGTGESFRKVFPVNSENSILLQQAALPSTPGDYSVDVSGSGCVYTQTTLRYNVILPGQASGFALDVQTRNASCTGNFLPKFELVVTARYTGERNTSNMVIVDIKMPSGYVPVQTSLRKLQDKVMRTETKNDRVLLYLDHLSAQDETLAFFVEESHPVANRRPAHVLTYDYYETDEFALAEYNTPCHQASE